MQYHSQIQKTNHTLPVNNKLPNYKRKQNPITQEANNIYFEL